MLTRMRKTDPALWAKVVEWRLQHDKGELWDVNEGHQK